MPENEADLALLIDAARHAGEIALRYWRRDPKVQDKPDGAGPVTEADLAVDAHLRDLLTAARPGYGWLSEESEDSAARLSAERLFIIDPIDGTRAFIAGKPDFAHSLAVVVGGSVTAAVVYAPASDKLYCAAAGGPARLNGREIAASRRDKPDGAAVLANAAAVEAGQWPGGVPDLRRSFRPSLALRLCLVAEGAYDAALSLRETWEWDVAAGDLIARAAGARVSDRRGQALRYNAPRPLLPGLLASAAGIHGTLIRRLATPT